MITKIHKLNIHKNHSTIKKCFFFSLIAFCMVAICMFGFSSWSAATGMKTEFTGTFKGGCIDTTPHLKITFDPVKYIKEDSTKYDSELSTDLSLFAHCVYADAGQAASLNHSNVILDGSKYLDSDPTGFARGLGLDDLYFNDLSTGTYYNLTGKDIAKPEYIDGLDQDDTTAYLFGHRHLTIDGKDYEFILVAVRGTNGSVAEWSSNFDVGANIKAYFDRTGDHPEWKHKVNHKGFDVAAYRVYRAFNSYMSQVIDKNAEKAVFTTGHSRGAAIANILGKEFEDLHNKGELYKTATYTFAPPASTTAADSVINSYQTIFNICNGDDFVPLLPPEACGFRLYGKKLVASVANGVAKGEKSGEKLSTLLNSFVGDGFKYSANTHSKDIENAFNDIVKCRDDFYKVVDWGSDESFTFYCNSNSAADKKLAELESLGLLKYCSYKKVDGTIWGTNIQMRPSPAYMARILSLLANDSTWATHILSHVGSGQLWGKFYDVPRVFILAAVQGIDNVHMTTSYYALAKYAF